MMLNAKKAMEITNAAVEKRNAEIREVIEAEVAYICDYIREAAEKRHTSYKISPGMLSYREGVAAYLKDELGYTCQNYTDGAIVVSWASAN